MRRAFFVVAFAAILPILVLSGCLRDSSKGEVLATYDGGGITEADFKTALDNLPDRVREVAVRQKKDYLDSLVTEKVLLQEAESRGIQHLADVQNLIRQARDRILVTKLLEDEVENGITVDDAAARSYYDTHKEEFTTPFRLRASHILLRSREEAESVLAELQAGGSFEELAKTLSLDPTASKGGDIGFFEKGQLIPEIEEAAFGLQKDELSGIIQSSFGFHILKVTGEAKPQVKEFDLVKDEIRERLLVEKKSAQFDDLVNRLKEKAGVELDEKALDGFVYGSASPEANEKP
ncbi:MAG: peptidyl-prolyl cis-trans isomerase [Candidatus Omnitrophica bacterium]|nr:peptidyl-prolyl cis-trans isomerase [Candidatus Omnitrophota bacterium]